MPDRFDFGKNTWTRGRDPNTYSSRITNHGNVRLYSVRSINGQCARVDVFSALNEVEIGLSRTARHDIIFSGEYE